MVISQEKKDFIKKTAPGIHVYMATSYIADEISADAEEPVEEYIRDNILIHEKSAVGITRAWFSGSLFCKAVDTLEDDKLRELLVYLDTIDMCLCDVFVESCIDTKDLTENEKKYVDLIMDGKLGMFEDFIDKY